MGQKNQCVWVKGGLYGVTNQRSFSTEGGKKSTSKVKPDRRRKPPGPKLTGRHEKFDAARGVARVDEDGTHWRVKLGKTRGGGGDRQNHRGGAVRPRQGTRGKENSDGNCKKDNPINHFGHQHDSQSSSRKERTLGGKGDQKARHDQKRRVRLNRPKEDARGTINQNHQRKDNLAENGGSSGAVGGSGNQATWGVNRSSVANYSDKK